MFDTGGFETALIVFAGVLAVLVAVGIGLIVSTVRRERDERQETLTGPEPAQERTRELVS